MAASVRDRTSDFFRIAQQARDAGIAPAPPPPRSQAKNGFSRTAAGIALSIQQTSSKLQKLTKLAQSKQLYNDPALEIQELTFVIKEDLRDLHQQIKLLSDVMDAAQEGRSTGGNVNAEALAGAVANPQAQTHSGRVVDSLKNQLKETTSSFQSVLETRTENLRQQQDRRAHYTGRPGGSVLGGGGGGGAAAGGDGAGVGGNGKPNVAAGRGLGGEMKQRRVESVLFKPPGGGGGGEGDGASGDTVLNMSALGGSEGGEQSQMMLQRNDRYLESRAEAITNVQRTIAELGGIFEQLATMVHEQGEMIERIDDTVDDSVTQVNRGRDELLKYWNSVSSNRALILKVFGILFFFMILFIGLR